ncbi:MAG: hypothetical protein KTR16_11605 [Acidiferrobacterales bacterium]|nr:hypothetical protein [Acidiferrobacterales bacterium]
MNRALFYSCKPKDGEVCLFVKTENNGSLGLFTSDGNRVLGVRVVNFESKFNEVTVANVTFLPTAPPLEK